MATGWPWVLPPELSFINMSPVHKLQLAPSIAFLPTQVTRWKEKEADFII
jgi:hypothetical protein